MLPSQKPFRGIQLNRTHPLAKGLVGCWLFNEATGETVFDLSGHGNNGTLENGVAWRDSGLEFDGVDDYVDCGNNDSLNITDAITIEAWVKSPNNIEDETNDKIIIQKGLSYGLKFDANNTDKLQFFFHDGVSWRSAYSTKTSWTANTWYHIAVTFQKPNVVFYVNTVSDNTESLNYSIADSAAAFYIGATGVESFNGSIRSLNIYNQAKSADEIAWLYREPYAMFEPAFNPAIYGAVFTKREILNLTSTIDKTLATTSTIDKTLATTSTINKTLALSSKMDIEAAA